MEKDATSGIVMIGLSGGGILERGYHDILQIFDPKHGPTTIFVRKGGGEIIICRVHEETDRFVRDEPITPARLEELEEESRIYLGEETEGEIEKLNEQVGEVFMGELENPFSKQTKFDVMYV